MPPWEHFSVPSLRVRMAQLQLECLLPTAGTSASPSRKRAPSRSDTSVSDRDTQRDSDDDVPDLVSSSDEEQESYPSQAHSSDNFDFGFPARTTTALPTPLFVAAATNSLFPCYFARSFIKLVSSCYISEFQQAGFDLPTLARSRHLQRTAERLSVDRVYRTFGPGGPAAVGFSDRDFQRLLRLADVGVDIVTAPNFRPCPEPAPLRPRYIQVQAAIHKLLHQQMVTGTVVVLPLELVRHIPGIHFANSQHWTTKKNKAHGRSIADVSNSADPEHLCPLNGFLPEDKLAVSTLCEEHYGTIRHPTLHSLANMVLIEVEQHGWDDVMLWKMDLQGAFTLLWIRADHTPLLEFPLVAGLVVIHLIGLFGWAGMPAAFQVLTRTLEALIGSAITGSSCFYVDDLMPCSIRSNIKTDQAVARDIITSLAGPGALAPDKEEVGRRLDFIGWQFCLDRRTVSVSRRNLLKTVHAFFCFPLGARLPRLLLQRMGSLAIRISELCAFMRPFTASLTADLHGFRDSSPMRRRRLSPLALCDIAMWRAFLVFINLEAVSIVRPLVSFGNMTPTVAIEYDASLTGLAAGVSFINDRGEYMLQRFAAVAVPFNAAQ